MPDLARGYSAVRHPPEIAVRCSTGVQGRQHHRRRNRAMTSAGGAPVDESHLEAWTDAWPVRARAFDLLTSAMAAFSFGRRIASRSGPRSLQTYPDLWIGEKTSILTPSRHPAAR